MTYECTKPFTSNTTLLLLLRIGSHLFAKGEVGHFQAGERPNADKENEEERDNGSESHEQSGCKVLVCLEKAGCARRVCALVVRGEITLQLELFVVSERILHLIRRVLFFELGFGHSVVDRRGNVNDGVVGRIGDKLVIDGSIYTC
jgi:hypothetical protein